jgi:U3 small nucleolar RNA-associated protein 12
VLVSVASGDVLQELDVHEQGSVWSISLKADGSGFCSGGSDKCVRFFDFNMDEQQR